LFEQLKNVVEVLALADLYKPMTAIVFGVGSTARAYWIVFLQALTRASAWVMCALETWSIVIDLRCR
jgi:hypothetical protein